MKNLKVNYPRSINVCGWCKSKEIALRSELVRLGSGDITAVFRFECTECGYSTKSFDRADIAAHAWNIAIKLEIADLIKSTEKAY